MSSGNKGSVPSSAAASSSIPAASRKMVLSLKEIVSCSELEIYAMLKECNMDPNETVDRLLTQDRFHEVKSKREKKKEGKDPSESRPRGGGHNVNRGGRGNGDRYGGRNSSTQFASTESSAFHGKSAHKKENGTYFNTDTSSHVPQMPGNNTTHRPLSWSDSVENKISTRGAGDDTFSSSQPSEYQSAWVGVPGQLSMADIVKMGRPPSKNSSAINQPHHNVHDHLTEPPLIGSNQDWPSSQDYSSNDDWPVIEQPPTVAMPSVIEEPIGSSLYADTSSFPFASRPNQTHEYQIDEVQVQEDDASESRNPNFVRSGSASSRSVRSVQEDNHGSASHYDNDMYTNINSYQPHTHAYEAKKDGGGSLSSISASMQKLNLRKDEAGAPPEEEDHSVVIPNHLQVHTADCSHLSFGSFGSGITTGDPVPFTSQTFNDDVEETPASTIAEASTVGNSDKNPEYYGDEHHITSSNGNLVQRTNTGTEAFSSHSASQPEVLNHDTPDVGQGSQYAFPSSTSGYTFENSQELNAAYAHSNSQMQNMGPFSSVMQAYTHSLPNALLASTIQPTRESDLHYSQFSASQSVPTKYNNTASSISGSSVPMSEQTQQAQPSGDATSGPALPQHLVHPYSQPTLPLGPFANMIGYPFLPQSYAYMPSAFQQAFGGNSSYHQSLAAALPQYKNNVSATNLPQSAAIASGYGAFGNSTSVPGNFPMNPTTGAAAGTTVGYDDIINSQYKDASQLLSLQQGDNSGMWVHGPGSRTMSAVPANTYYNFQGQQNQQPAAYRQAQQQQPSQQFGAHGYPNYYQSQTGLSLEHQQQQLQQQQLQQQLQQHHQSLKDGTTGGSQGQQSKQSQQLWQNNY